jgi:hypothetical protein
MHSAQCTVYIAQCTVYRHSVPSHSAWDYKIKNSSSSITQERETSRHMPHVTQMCRRLRMMPTHVSKHVYPIENNGCDKCGCYPIKTQSTTSEVRSTTRSFCLEAFLAKFFVNVTFSAGIIRTAGYDVDEILLSSKESSCHRNFSTIFLLRYT